MLSCLVNVRRCPLPTTPSSQRHHYTRSLPRPVSALFCSDLFLSSLNFRLSTFNCSFLTPFFATLTDTVRHKSFAYHSYKKHRGVGYAVQSKFLFCPHASANSFVIRASEKHTRNPFRIRISKTQHLKPFRIRIYRKTGRGVEGTWDRNSCLSLVCLSTETFPRIRRMLGKCRRASQPYVSLLVPAVPRGTS